ncbi:Uncharacterised protein [Bordetella pertussis]|nr:Uncharacterised protein [Bordetella pertussis]
MSRKVGKLASEISATCAPPSPRPMTVFGSASICAQASRFWSA